VAEQPPSGNRSSPNASADPAQVGTRAEAQVDDQKSESRKNEAVSAASRASEASSVVQQTAHPVDAYGDPLPVGAIARLGTLRFRHDSRGTEVYFLAGASQFVTGGPQGSVRIWDRETGRVVRSTKEAGMRFGAMALSPDQKSIALIGAADGTSTVDNCMMILIDVATGNVVKEVTWVESRPAEWTVQFSLDGKSIVTVCDQRRVRVWDATTLQGDHCVSTGGGNGGNRLAERIGTFLFHSGLAIDSNHCRGLDHPTATAGLFA
jgi:WD40 repeat protein